MSKIFIADPALKSHQGHHYAVTERFSSSLVSSCDELIWLVNKQYQLYDAEIHDKCLVEAVFSEGTYDGHKRLIGQDDTTPDGPWYANLSNKASHLLQKSLWLCQKLVRGRAEGICDYLQNIIDKLDTSHDVDMHDIPLPEFELYQVLIKHNCTGDDLVIFHTSDAHTYRDVLALFVKMLPLDQWNDYPVFVLSTPYDLSVMPHNDSSKSVSHSVMHMKALGLIDARILLFAENELLAEYLSHELEVNVSPLYIPIDEHSLTNCSEAAHNKEVLNFVYMGPARTEKGFVVISDIIEKFLANSDRRDISFTIQITPQILGYSNDVNIAVSKLKKINDIRLHLIGDTLSPGEYGQVLQAADVILLYYDPDRYSVRSSGIIIEAVENCKITITRKGTFPAYIAGEAGVTVDTPDEILSAINRILANQEAYKHAANNRRSWLLEKCSATRVLAMINRGKEIDVPSLKTEEYNVDESVGREKLSWRRLV